MENYDNVYPFEEVHGTARNKWNELKAKMDRTVGRIGNWVSNNKDEIIGFAGVGVAVVGAASGLLRAVNNSSWGTRRQKEANALKMHCYDRSAGHYWELKRPLSNQEWAVVENRRKNGERIGDILESMKVLK